jgi:hypothetical protein
MRIAHRPAYAASVALACMLTARPGFAEPRVAAIDPDAELAHALEAALAPWGTTVVSVHVDTPGSAMPIAAERAREIARGERVDVVVWVSSADSGYALWIYDVESDHASARRIESAPPFEPSTAAAAALAVKTLLQGTVVAPLPERLGAVAGEPSWLFGVSVGAASHLDEPIALAARFGVHASVWPRALGHRWGASVDAEDGTGMQVNAAAFNGTLNDAALRLGLGLRAPLGNAVVLEPSIGAVLQIQTLDGVVLAERATASEARFDVGFDPRLGVDFSLLGGRVHVEPWIGATVQGRWQRYHVHGVTVAESGPILAEAAVRVAFGVP